MLKKKKKSADPPYLDKIGPRQARLEHRTPPKWKKSTKIVMGTFHTNHFASIPTFFTSFFSFLNFDYIGHLSFQSQSPGDYIVGTYFWSRYQPMAG